MRERLVAAGLYEVRTSKLLPRERFAFGEKAIELRNPLSEDHVALRPSLLPGLLGVLDHNIRAGAERVAIFETGRVFEPPSGAEKKRVAILVWGNVGSEVHWRNEKRRLDFFDLKGAIELTRKEKLSFQRGLQENRSLALTVEILANHDLVGVAGQLSDALSSKLDASGAVLVAEVSLDFPEETRGSHATFRELGKFPAVTRDIAMIVPDTLSHEQIWKVIDEPEEPLLERVAFFDRVVGKEAEQLFGPGKKSVAYRLTYRDQSRTLTSEEVNAAHAKIRERLRSDLGAELRE
jgi:phenylalanyl-tRNA synthetase beta chain